MYDDTTLQVALGTLKSAIEDLETTLEQGPDQTGEDAAWMDAEHMFYEMLDVIEQVEQVLGNPFPPEGA